MSHAGRSIFVPWASKSHDLNNISTDLLDHRPSSEHRQFFYMQSLIELCRSAVHDVLNFQDLKLCCSGSYSSKDPHLVHAESNLEVENARRWMLASVCRLEKQRRPCCFLNRLLQVSADGDAITITMPMILPNATKVRVAAMQMQQQMGRRRRRASTMPRRGHIHIL